MIPSRKCGIQVEERQTVPLVLLRDRHDQAQVRIDEHVLRTLVAALDRLGELDLLRGGQQREPAGFVQEELEGVGRRRRNLRVRVRNLWLDRSRAVVGDLDAVRLEPLEQDLDVLFVELELLDDLVQLRHVDAAVLVAVLHEERDGIDRGHQRGMPASPGLTL